MINTRNSFSQTSNFKIHLPFLGQEVAYAQSINIPGISFEPEQIFAGSGKKLMIGGDSIGFDDLSISFINDDSYELYKKLLKYCLKRVHYNSGVIEPLKEFTTTIEITNNIHETKLVLEFYGCKVRSISGMELVSNSDDSEMTFELGICFDDFNFKERI